ncbi:MAG: hypothetical protein Q4A21_03500 [bacterium]|nr:hypothetical protein [bacterium]
MASSNPGFDKKKVFENVSLPQKNANDDSIKNILNNVFFWAGVVAVVVIMVAGIYYAISAGDSSKISKAKNALTYAIVGLLVVIFSAVIVNFVLGVF